MKLNTELAHKCWSELNRFSPGCFGPGSFRPNLDSNFVRVVGVGLGKIGCGGI